MYMYGVGHRSFSSNMQRATHAVNGQVSHCAPVIVDCSDGTCLLPYTSCLVVLAGGHV
jgi:hypothetical protein